MSWTIIYHPEVVNDLKSIGPSVARRIMRTIDKKLIADPLKYGRPLSGGLSGFQKLRIGDYRVVYQIRKKEIVVFVLAVGPRRDKEIYKSALQRI